MKIQFVKVGDEVMVAAKAWGEDPSLEIVATATEIAHRTPPARAIAETGHVQIVDESGKVRDRRALVRPKDAAEEASWKEHFESRIRTLRHLPPDFPIEWVGTS